jgi:hypothetical protein
LNENLDTCGWEARGSIDFTTDSCGQEGPYGGVDVDVDGSFDELDVVGT